MRSVKDRDHFFLISTGFDARNPDEIFVKITILDTVIFKRGDFRSVESGIAFLFQIDGR